MDKPGATWHVRATNDRRAMTETSFTPGPDSIRAYREALGCFGTGVTVVTIATADGPLAMTVNSFTSVSLDPPLVLWCPAKASPRHGGFAAAAWFAVHVMREDQHDTALHFSHHGQDFDAVGWSADANGTPILSDCLARFDCRRVAMHDGGDHSIILGQVLNAMHRPGKGLMFKRGQYGGFTDVF